MRDYNHYKDKYAKTLPIRGRADDVRPIGIRRYDTERITRKEYLSREVSYCATLHRTDVVEYHNNGEITLRTNGWHTTSTAEFMHTHSPFIVWKQENKLWVRMRTRAGVMCYPVGDELTVRMVDCEAMNMYEPTKPVTIMKRVVDRAKANAAREPLRPFLAWAKTFLTMSDGWIMAETRSAVETKHDFFGGSKVAYECMCGATPDGYMGILLALLPGWGDLQFGYKQVRSKVYSISDTANDIHKLVEVQPSSKAVRNAQ